MTHDTITNYYHLNAQMQRYHHFSLTELESMFPFEREAYVILIKQSMQEEEELMKKSQESHA